MAAVRQTRPELLDSAGHVVEETPLFGGVFWSAYDDTESGTLRYLLGPGHYRLVVHGADGSGFNRELTVPWLRDRLLRPLLLVVPAHRRAEDQLDDQVVRRHTGVRQLRVDPFKEVPPTLSPGRMNRRVSLSALLLLVLAARR
jgi:hypothetical protein